MTTQANTPKNTSPDLSGAYQPRRMDMRKRVNLVFFFLVHILLVLNLRHVLGSVTAIGIGIIVGLGALVLYIVRPAVWNSPLLASILVLCGIVQFFSYDVGTKRELVLAPLEFYRSDDGSYHFNRGGIFVLDRYYLVMAPEDAGWTGPKTLGAGRVVESRDLLDSRIEWIGIRASFRDWPRYRVRPMREGEGVPKPFHFATLAQVLGGKRAEIDRGSEGGVRVGFTFVYRSIEKAEPDGHLVIDAVMNGKAEGYLVGAIPKAPRDLEFAGWLDELVQMAAVRGEIARQSGRLDEARAYFAQALRLKDNRDPGLQEKLDNLPPALSPDRAPGPEKVVPATVADK